MWILLLLIAIGAGWQIIRSLPIKFYLLEAAAACIAVGFVVAPWVFFLAALCFGWNAGMFVATGILFSGIIAAQQFLPRRAVFERPVRPNVSTIVSWLLAGATAMLLTYLMFRSYNFQPHADWYSNGNAWGDSAFHVDLISHFSYGNSVDLTSPVYKHIRQTYPFMADLWSGVLLRTTSNWIFGLLAPSILELWALLALLYFFAKRLLQSRLAAWLAFYMLVFSGSLQGIIDVINALRRHTYSNFYAHIHYSITSVTHDGYLNFFNSHIIPQRAFAFGMPLFIISATIFLELYRQRTDMQTKSARTIAVTAGFLTGLLPFVHTFSFLVLAGVLALATAALWYKKQIPPGWLVALSIGAVVAAPQLVWQASQSYYPGFGHWIFGWVVEDSTQTQRNWLVYWFANAGILLIAIFFGWYWLKKYRSKPEIWLAYIAGVLIFVICNFYVFQPTIWDNMKFFEYGFWFLMLATASLFARWFQTVPGKFTVGILMVSLCSFGIFVMAVVAPGQNFQLLSRSEVAFGKRLSQELPQNTYILADNRHNSPVTMLAGRNMLMTYNGWYNLYGKDWQTTSANRDAMLRGDSGTLALIKSYGVSFAAFDDDDVTDGNANLAFYQKHFKLFAQSAGWWIFDLRQPR